jgi:hypothetical protein
MSGVPLYTGPFSPLFLPPPLFQSMSQFNQSSDKPPIWARIIVAISWVMLVGGAVVYWSFFRREHHEWSEEIKLWDGRKLPIQRHNSDRVYHGGHGFGWGGGDPWEDVQFTIVGKEYRWEGPYIPIAIQPDKDNTVYLVVFDRESDFSHPGFRLYRATSQSKWEEIPPAQFPKHLAIQNTWLRKNNGIGMDGKVLNEYQVVSEMDPGFIWFRESLTAKLWSCLDDPNFSYNNSPSEKFVRQFKAKWIRPLPAYRPDGAPW